MQENVATGSTNTSTNYVWGEGLIEQIRDDQVMFYHADALGSVKALSDRDGNVKGIYEYDAFGVLERHGGTTENSYRYSGEYFDDVAGLQYNRARWMDARIGRFASQDEFRGNPTLPATLNKYLYASSDAVNGTDPSGLETLNSLGTAEVGGAAIASTPVPSFGVYIAGARAMHLATAGAGFLATQGQNISRVISGSGKAGWQALQSSVYIAARTGNVTVQTLSSAMNLGSSYTAQLNQMIGTQASNFGMQVHRLLASNFGLPSTLTNSIANMAPTPTTIHQAINGLHARHLLNRGMSLNTAITQYLVRNQNSPAAVEKVYQAEANVWAYAMQNNATQIMYQDVSRFFPFL